jgi:cell division protein FtsI/penicillin-binding protein 2
MKFRSCLIWFLLVLTACTQSQITPTQIMTAEATRTLRPVIPTIISAPKAASAAETFLQAWKAEDYQAMYAMLTPVSQDALTLEKFTQRYSDVAISTTLDKIDYEILSTMTNPTSAQVSYQVVFHTQMLGDLTEKMTMNLSMEKSAWRVQWDDGLIMPELKGGNQLALDLKAPTRGNIYDRNGKAVAVASEIVALGMVKGEISDSQLGLAYSELSRLTGKDPEWIKAQYESDSVYNGTYIPVGEVSKEKYAARYDVVSGIHGVYANPYTGRLYLDGGIAPHVTGYVGAIQAEEKDKYLRQGFRIDDRVGITGLELWGEKYLIGQRGATLYVNDPQGSPVTRLAQVESKPSQSITMTIDADLQLEAQKAITGFSGAIVVMERDSGRVLAMVSSPGFDPNAFEFQNYNFNTLVGTITGDGRARLYDRASGNGYPLGSVFKIITMATALETGIFKPDDTYDCQYYFTDIPGIQLKDWTLDHDVAPSGILTLPEGLMRSCNPWFYRIGMELFRQGKTKELSDMARAFGLGSPTGIQGVAEESGNIPDATDELMNARIAIGQSEVLVNPLQVARFVAAVGNGGTLYRPQVIEKITDPDGNASFTFKADAQSKLPVKLENLKIIQQAMRWVVSDKRGTAVRAFSGFSIPVYGKTGTAESDLNDPHAWFAAYTDAGRADKPDIAIAVIAEYSGDGSAIAAPIARRVMEVYFMGQPQRIYPWESRINVTRTPTPSVSETPVPPDQPQGGGGNNGGTDPTTPPDINLRTNTPSP